MAASRMGGIIERIREKVGDEDHAEYANDSQLVGAAARYIEDSYGPSVTGITYTVDRDAQTIDPPIDGSQLLIVALGASIRLLEGTLAREAKDVISMDSPAGRINTNERPREIRALIATLKTDLKIEMLRYKPAGIEWVDTNFISSAREDGSNDGTQMGQGVATGGGQY